MTQRHPPMSKLYTAIVIIMLMTSCANNEELSNEQKFKIVEKEMQDKLSDENAAKLLDSMKAAYGDSVNYVSDIYLGAQKDTLKR